MYICNINAWMISSSDCLMPYDVLFSNACEKHIEQHFVFVSEFTYFWRKACNAEIVIPHAFQWIDQNNLRKWSEIKKTNFVCLICCNYLQQIWARTSTVHFHSLVFYLSIFQRKHIFYFVKFRVELHKMC